MQASYLQLPLPTDPPAAAVVVVAAVAVVAAAAGGVAAAAAGAAAAVAASAVVAAYAGGVVDMLDFEVGSVVSKVSQQMYQAWVLSHLEVPHN